MADNLVEEVTTNQASSNQIATDAGTQDVRLVPEASAGSEQNANTQVSTTVPSEQVSQVQNETKRNFEAEIGKMSALEKERNELRKELESVKTKASSFDALDSALRNSPEDYERFRRLWSNTYGQDIGSYQDSYGNSVVQNNGQQGYVNQQQIEQLAMNAARQQIENQRGLEELWSEYPELDPKKISQDDADRVGQTVSNAVRLAESLRAINPTLSVGDALKMGYRALPENQNKLLSQAKEAGEMIGMQKAYAKASGTTSGITGGSPSNAGSRRAIPMTRSQEDTYNRLLRENPGVAQRYYDNIAGGKS